MSSNSAPSISWRDLPLAASFSLIVMTFSVISSCVCCEPPSNAKFGPVVTPAKMSFDPHKMVRAIERGSRINFDLTDHWDFWPDMELPIAEVRRKYNISEN